jgi:hypothetical protein
MRTAAQAAGTAILRVFDSFDANLIKDGAKV